MSALRAALAARRLAGIVVTFADPVVAELVAEPFDVVWIDLEHGALDVRDVPALAVAARAAGAWSLVRVPGAAPERLAPVLDAGVDGIVVPRVGTAAEAAAAVAGLRYPPRGVRGFGPRRAGGYGRDAPPDVVCLAQIESAAGVAAAPEIAAVDGVDGLVAGPADLRLDRGEEDVDADVAAVVAAARRAAVAPGIATAEPRLAALIAPGPGLLVPGVDCRLLARAADASARAARSAWA